MLSFLLSFASIKADDIPAGVMPNKRQVAGTGVSTSSTTQETSSTDPPSSTTPITSETPTSDTPTSDTVAPTSVTTTPPSSDNTTPTSDGTTPTVESTSDASSAAPTDAAPSSTIPTTIAVTTTNADGSVVTSSIATSTLAPASSGQTSADGLVVTESGSKNSVVRIGSSTIDPATLSHKTVVTSALVGSITSESVYTSYWTSNGQAFSSLVTTDRVLASTTGFATATINPSLANGGGNGSNLSTNTKRVIGGVVGGIGGAILVGGIALVAWRLWGKKRRQEEGPAEWTDSQNDSIRREKTQSMSNYGGEVDRYRNPGGSVNTASNF